MSVPVALAVKAACLSLQEELPEIAAVPLTLQAALYVARMYRIVGTGKLLGEGDSQAFSMALSKGGGAYLAFLEGATDEQKVTGKSEPFFDAVAAGDEVTAMRIASLSRDALNRGREYEEDFYYHLLMMRLFAGAPASAIQPLLDGYDAVGADDRCGLCRALHLRDQHGFDAALDAASRVKRAELARATDKQLLSPDEAVTVVHVSTEVLSWVALGKRLGLEVAADHPLAPSLARVAATSLAPRGGWMQPDDSRELE